MHREAVDRTAYGRGPLQGWDPRLKVGLTLGTLALIAVGATDVDRSSWVRLGAIAVVLLAVGWLARLPLAVWFRRSLWVLPFAGFVAIGALIEVVPGVAEGVPVGSWTIALAPGGVERALLILLRAWSSILITLVLAMTTPFPAVLAALEHARVPRGFVQSCALVYRYLWVVVEEARRLLLARRLRVGRVAPWQSGARIIGALFARSLSRARRLEMALLLRSPEGGWPRGAPLAWTSSDSLRLGVGILVWSLVALAPHGVEALA